MYQDPQYMELVSHVSSCPYLAQGLYQCPYCNKEESFCWDVNYPFGDKESGGAHSLPGYHGNHHMAPATTQSPTAMAGPFAETGPESYPEVFVNDTRGHRSPHSQASKDPSKSKYASFDGPLTPAYPAELPDYRHYLINELPTQNTVPQGSNHVSPRTSPESVQRGLHVAQSAFPMGGVAASGPFVHMNVREPSPLLSPGFEGPAQTMQSPQPNTANGFPQANGGGSQHDLAGRMRPAQPVSSRRSLTLGDGSGSAGSGISAAGTAEAAKGSVTCKQCGKVLRGKVAWLPSNLQRHMREIHLSAPRTECRICGRSFNRGHNLRQHMRAVHGEQP